MPGTSASANDQNLIPVMRDATIAPAQPPMSAPKIAIPPFQNAKTSSGLRPGPK